MHVYMLLEQHYFLQMCRKYCYDCNMNSTDQLAQVLKQHGQSITKQRRCVFDALQGREPQTMHEIVSNCTQIDRASVYRAIALFERLGIVQRLQTGWKYRLELSDEFHEHHHHATCLLCGQSQVVAEDSAVEQQLHRLAEQLGFQLEKHQLELQGYCAKCQYLLKD